MSGKVVKLLPANVVVDGFQDKYGNGYLYSFYRKRLLPLDHQLYKLAYLYLYSDYEEFEKLYKQDY